MMNIFEQIEIAKSHTKYVLKKQSYKEKKIKFFVKNAAGKLLIRV